MVGRNREEGFGYQGKAYFAGACRPNKRLTDAGASDRAAMTFTSDESTVTVFLLWFDLWHAGTLHLGLHRFATLVRPFVGKHALKVQERSVVYDAVSIVSGFGLEAQGVVRDIPRSSDQNLPRNRPVQPI